MSTNDLQKPHLSIVVPIYNEESRIGATLIKLEEYIHTKDFIIEVLLVLNNCTDGTRSVIDFLENKPKNLRVIDMGILPNMGNTKGVAVTKGVLGSRGEYVVFIDADLATPLEEIDKLLQYIDRADVIIGSRRAPGGVIDRPQVWYRVWLGSMANVLIQTLLLPGIKDTQCGCKLFSHTAAQNIFKQVTVWGWGFDIEILVLAKKANYRVQEVGVHWHDVDGSKVHARAYGSTLKELVKIVMKLKFK